MHLKTRIYGFSCFVLLGSFVAFTGCEDTPCCEQYIDSLNLPQADELYYLHMCHQMTDNSISCSLKEVDRYVNAAESCCAPLNSEPVSYISLNEFRLNSSQQAYISTGNPWVESIYPVYYELSHSASSSLNYSYSYIPGNAYSWCLANTDISNYQCDVQKAEAFGQAISSCKNYSNDIDEKICLLSLMNSKATPVHEDKVDEHCCDNLDEKWDEFRITKSECLQILQDKNQCVTRHVDVCCMDTPYNFSAGHISLPICESIYYSSIKDYQCVNTDELLQEFLKE